MLETHQAVLRDVLSCLEGISRQALAPSQAQGELNAVRSRYPDTSIELVWDEQVFDGSRHYDALVRPQGFEGTVSLSVCHDEALPWPLRGLQAWRDSELLRVNGVVMPVENAIRHLDLLWERKPLMRRLIDSCLIEAESERRQIAVEPAEVQSMVDDIRRRRGLLTAAATHAWLAESGTSMQGLTDLAGRLARAAKLRAAVVSEDVDRYMEAHRDAFDVIHTRVLQTPDVALATQVAETVRQGARSFLHAAEDAVFGDRSGRTQFFYRRELRHQLDARLDKRTPYSAGALLGPTEEGDERLVIDVVAVEPAKNNQQLRAAVVAELFEEWLREQRRKARIEWFWGPNGATNAAR